MFFVFVCIPDRNKTQDMCNRVVYEDTLLIVYCPDKYKTQRMCEEAVDDFLATLKLISDLFVTSKMIQKLYTALYTDGNILYFNEDSGNATFCCNEVVILSVNPNNINLHNNFDKDDLDTIILIRLLAWYIKFGKRKNVKKR